MALGPPLQLVQAGEEARHARLLPLSPGGPSAPAALGGVSQVPQSPGPRVGRVLPQVPQPSLQRGLELALVRLRLLLVAVLPELPAADVHEVVVVRPHEVLPEATGWC